MNDKINHNKLSFALTSAAEEHLGRYLQKAFDQCSKSDLVLIFSYTGTSSTRNGNVRNHGPSFILAGQRTEALGKGKFYDLLGIPVWIDDCDNILLEGNVVTLKNIDQEGKDQILTVENVPANLRNKICSCT